MDHFAVLTPHGQLLHSGGYNFQKGFIKDLWNSLWTAGDPSGPLQINCSKTKALVRTQKIGHINTDYTVRWTGHQCRKSYQSA